MNKKTKSLQNEEKSDIIVYRIVKSEKGLSLLEIKIPEDNYEIVRELNLKNSLAESTFFIKKFFVELLSKMF